MVDLGLEAEGRGFEWVVGGEGEGESEVAALEGEKISWEVLGGVGRRDLAIRGKVVWGGGEWWKGLRTA